MQISHKIDANLYDYLYETSVKLLIISKPSFYSVQFLEVNCMHAYMQACVKLNMQTKTKHLSSHSFQLQIYSKKREVCFRIKFKTFASFVKRVEIENVVPSKRASNISIAKTFS